MPSDRKLDRRRAGKLMLSAAAAAYLAPNVLAGQPFDKDKDKDKKKQPNSRAPQVAPTVDVSKVLTVGKRRDWTLKAEVNVDAWVREARDPRREIDQPELFEFTYAAVVFPMLRGSSCHRTHDGELKSELRFDELVVSEKPDELVEGSFPCGTRLARWDLRAPQGKVLKGRSMKLKADISMSCWRTEYNEELAKLVPWPKGSWGNTAATTFTDLQRVGNVNLVDHTTEGVQTLVRQWCNNKDPKSQPPVEVAKFLASNVLEYIKRNGDGLNFADNGLFEGMDVVGSEAALANKQGCDQDITCALAAVYRAAGLPARTVIGFDVVDDKGGDDTFLKRRRDVPAFRSWVEFCLYDEKTRKEYWIPVDINRQRQKSSRILRNMKAWTFFGANDEFDMVCPFAFQFHPPTSVIAHGSVAFWGWMTLGDKAPKAEQFLRFNTITTPRTKNTEQDRKNFEDEQKRPQPKK